MPCWAIVFIVFARLGGFLCLVYVTRLRSKYSPFPPPFFFSYYDARIRWAYIFILITIFLFSCFFSIAFFVVDTPLQQ